MMIAILARLFLFVFCLAFFIIGTSGLLTAPWELKEIFGLDPNWLASEDAASFLNQYRFLKVIEGGFGLFGLLKLKSILDGGVSNIIFLTGCGLAVIARSFSWMVDGRPDAMFIAFLVIEALTFLLVLIHSKRARG